MGRFKNLKTPDLQAGLTGQSDHFIEKLFFEFLFTAATLRIFENSVFCVGSQGLNNFPCEVV